MQISDKEGEGHKPSAEASKPDPHAAQVRTGLAQHTCSINCQQATAADMTRTANWAYLQCFLVLCLALQKLARMLGRSLRVDEFTAQFYLSEAEGDIKKAMRLAGTLQKSAHTHIHTCARARGRTHHSAHVCRIDATEQKTCSWR